MGCESKNYFILIFERILGICVIPAFAGMTVESFVISPPLSFWIHGEGY